MKNKLIKYAIIFFSWVVVVYPLLMAVQNRVWAWDETLLANIFPLFGLAAYSILWLHVVGPAVESWIDRYVNFRRFLDQTSPFILVFMLLHPLIVLYLVKFDLNFLRTGGPYIQLGLVGLVLLLTFDIGELLRRKNFVEKHWEKVLLASTIGFILIFFHSINIGHDLQGGTLRVLWIFFGTTSILAAIYNYGIKKLLK
jgi:hypothetical protein